MKEYLSLFKSRVAALLVFVAVITAVVASKGNLNFFKIFILALSGFLASVGAGILNHYFDRDIDKLMERTKERPIPSGKISPHKACYLGVVLLLLAIVISSNLNLLTSIYILLGALTYLLVYTIWLKRRNLLNIVIGGASGSFAVLAGYAAIRGETSILAILLALLIFLWTPPHFWPFSLVHREDYRKASIPMLPVVEERRGARLIVMHTILLIQASLLLYAFGYFGTVYLIIAAVSGLIFTVTNLLLLFNPTKEHAWMSYKLSGFYLIALFTGMFLDTILK